MATFSQEASDIDKDVAKTIKATKDEFVDRHDYIDVNWWTDLKEYFVDLKNKCPLFDAIGELIDDFGDWLGDTYASIKHWYKCGGGKETIGLVLAVAGAIAAVVIAICACVPPICGIVAICAAIGGVIAAVNAIVNVITSYEAKKAKEDGDPAWAKLYSDRDTLQDSLRQRRFKKLTFLNKWGGVIASGVDAVQTVCDVVAVFGSIKGLADTFKSIKRNTSSKTFMKGVKSYFLNKKGQDGVNMYEFINSDVKATNKLKMIEKLKSAGKLKKAVRLQNPSSIKRFADATSGIFKNIKAGIDISNSIKDILTGETNAFRGTLDVFNSLNFKTIKPFNAITGVMDKTFHKTLYKDTKKILKGFKYNIKVFKPC